MEYRFATDKDKADIIDFIDLVFSSAHRPHDFANLLSKVYCRDESHPMDAVHVIAEEDGRIRGCVAMTRFTANVSGTPLNYGYIGSVSVHRTLRNSGIMRELMQMQLDRALEDGVDIISLGGQRQRYGYYGFAQCGYTYEFSVNTANIRHALKDIDTLSSKISFIPMWDPEKVNFVSESDIDDAYALYNANCVPKGRTRENFVELLRSFSGYPLSIVRTGKENGEREYLGYLVATPESSYDSVTGIMLRDVSDVSEVIKAWFSEHSLESLRIRAEAWQENLAREISKFAEHCNIAHDALTLMLNPVKVANAWMQVKNSLHPLSDGRFLVHLPKYLIGTTWKEEQDLLFTAAGHSVSVTSAAADIAAATSSPDLPKVEMTEEELCHLLFSANRMSAPEIPSSVPADWFPFPMSLPMADTF